MKEHELTLVGLSEDRQTLVLVSDAGEEFTLPADARLRAALRGAPSRLGQLETTMESALRPRDIQARIRAGESPESVAAAAQTSIDKIMGYATPVLAERAYIADRAQRASVRRTPSEGPPRVLADAVAERLSTRGVDVATVQWDAWRREDGRWTLVADYLCEGSARQAAFVFDAPGRYVVAEDDEARWLVGEQSTPQDSEPGSGPGPRLLSAVGSNDELPLGEDAIGMVTGSGPASGAASGPAAGPQDVTEDLTATAAAVRGAEAAARADREPDEYPLGDVDWIATQASERPAGPERETMAGDQDSLESPVELGSEGDPEVADPAAGSADGGTGRGTAAETDTTEDATDPPRTAKKSRRASVPSWDEIMFGGGKQE